MLFSASVKMFGEIGPHIQKGPRTEANRKGARVGLNAESLLSEASEGTGSEPGICSQALLLTNHVTCTSFIPLPGLSFHLCDNANNKGNYRIRGSSEDQLS